ncbi:Nodulation protein NolJ [Ensifer psoraleae]|nr:Nodulation protein NolJ [Sinorhizobium psoraleae]
MVAAIGSFGSFGASLARAGGHGRSNGQPPHAPGGPSDPKKPADPNGPARGRDQTDIPPNSGGSQAASEQEAFQLALSAVAFTVMNDVMADAEETMADTEEDT